MRVMLLGLLLVVSGVQAFSQSERGEGDDGIAVVLRVVGMVEIGGVNANWEKAERGFSLASKTRLRTGRVSSCLLRFDDGSVIRIEANSEVEIRGQWRDATLDKRELQVDFGKIAFAVKKSGNEPFRFKSTTAVASIKGTEGTFDVSDEETALAIVASSRQTDVADFINQKTNQIESVGINESVSINRAGKFARRTLSAAERRISGNRIETLQSETKKGLKDLPARINPRRKPSLKQGKRNIMMRNLKKLSLIRKYLRQNP